MLAPSPSQPSFISSFCARVAELADAPDSKSGSARSVGSTPTPGTMLRTAPLRSAELRTAGHAVNESRRFSAGSANLQKQGMDIKESPAGRGDHAGQVFYGRGQGDYSAGGRMTASMTWMTPLDVTISVAVMVAPSIRSSPDSPMETVAESPLAMGTSPTATSL